MTHFYRRCAGAQNGEPPPLSPPQRRGTRGRDNKYFKVGGFRFLQALTTRECYSRFIVASPSGPLSRHGKGGGGKGQIRLWLPWERFCAQYGLISAAAVNQSVSSTASDRGLGAAPQACFGSFYTSKRNATAASRTNSVYYKACPTEGDYRLCHDRPGGRQKE